MVSRAEVAEQSQAHSQSHSRGARSSASRPPRSRHNSQHHHRGRSDFGAPNYAPLNEFPFFSQSGDVEIVVSCDGQEKRYLLHSFTLAQFSGFFEASTREEWSPPHAALTRGNGELPLTLAGDNTALSAIGEEGSQIGSRIELHGGAEIPGPSTSSQLQTSSALARRRWRYELDWQNLDDDDEPILVKRTPEGHLFRPSPRQPLSPIPPNIPHQQPSHHTSFFRSMANLTLSHHNTATQSSAHLASNTVPDPALTNALLRDYDNLFRIFYNYPPMLNSANIASAYSECKALLALADMYDALPVVGPRIDHHLLRFSSRLFKQIAKYPPSYLKLGYLARSRTIFTEAIIHVVGKWPAALPYLKPPDQNGDTGYDIPITVIHLIEDLVDELEELKQKIEMKLFRLTLTTSRGERVTPSNDYLGWLAMSLWRQWLAENTTPEVRGILKNAPTTPSSQRPGSGHSTQPLRPSQSIPRQPPPPYQLTNPAPPPSPSIASSRIFRLIASPNSSEAFLSHDELKRFLKIQPTHSSTPLYTRDNLRRFERKMDEIKNVARDIVKPLTRNCLELDLRTLSEAGSGAGTGGLGYLTCTRVEEEDLPWETG
ncbi:hypothetical protein PV10_02547 [Exophiala mesophila]|uniref:BTB domain-containing protein n=1 Tax=Exophiala mesophila TaxID=212818 RepID=A0A0D1WZ75_EXOME|nr:uncharacterized protein PV10_02547 [Exophiala mesophila]KIV94815.1 hypothetical protein PV10_02547 [Exophiala mesophila]